MGWLDDWFGQQNANNEPTNASLLRGMFKMPDNWLAALDPNFDTPANREAITNLYPYARNAVTGMLGGPPRTMAGMLDPNFDPAKLPVPAAAAPQMPPASNTQAGQSLGQLMPPRAAPPVPPDIDPNSETGKHA